ncbi:I11RA protein, partial [Spelaeornis formosus]|nr:I11RA protein [Elachura formosa]
MHSSILDLGKVMMFLTAALVSTSFALPEDWEEEGVQYGQLGTDVTLSCPGVRASSPVQWRRAGATALPEGSAIQQGSLVLPSASLAVMGTYSCHGEGGGLLHTVSLRLGHLPGVPLVSCRASDYENFSCSWTSSVETFLPTRYITTYREARLWGAAFISASVSLLLCDEIPGRKGCPISFLWDPQLLLLTRRAGHGFSSVSHAVICECQRGSVGLLCSGDSMLSYVNVSVGVWGCFAVGTPVPPLGYCGVHFVLPSHPNHLLFHLSPWQEEIPDGRRKAELLSGTLGLVGPLGHKDTFPSSSLWVPGVLHMLLVSVCIPAVLPDLASTASEETTTDARLENLAEEPSQAPNPEPINRSDPSEKMAVLVSLGIFAFFILAAVLVITILIWLRVRKHGKDKTKPNFLVAATHLKALPSESGCR